MNTVLKLCLQVLVHILTRIERGATVISGRIDARPGPFISNMTGTVAHPLVGSTISRSSATGVLTQTPQPVAHHVVLAVEVATAVDMTAVVIRHAPTLWERIRGIIQGRFLAMIDAILAALLLKHYGQVFIWIEHITHFLRVIVERRLH